LLHKVTARRDRTSDRTV